MLAIERCHIEVGAMVAGSYAAGLSVLARTRPISRRLDRHGRGTTTMAVFSGGRLVHGDGFAVGGQHVTMDIARGLNTSMSVAERIKTYYGSVLAGGSDERDISPFRLSTMLTAEHLNSFRARSSWALSGRDRRNSGDVRDGSGVSFAAEPRGRVVLRAAKASSTDLSNWRRKFWTAGSHRASAWHRQAPEEAKGPRLRGKRACSLPAAAHLEHFEEAAGERTYDDRRLYARSAMLRGASDGCS